MVPLGENAPIVPARRKETFETGGLKLNVSIVGFRPSPLVITLVVGTSMYGAYQTVSITEGAFGVLTPNGAR